MVGGEVEVEKRRRPMAGELRGDFLLPSGKRLDKASVNEIERTAEALHQYAKEKGPEVREAEPHHVITTPAESTKQRDKRRSH